MKEDIRYLDAWLTAYEGDDDDSNKDDQNKDDPNKDKTFDQEAVNKILAEERRKYQVQQQKMLDEVKALRTKSRMTDEERRELDTRLEKMQAEFLTKEELAKRQKEKEDKKHQDEITRLKQEVDKWQGRYTETSIKTAITGSAVKYKAYNSAQVIAILRPSTELEEAVDGEGNPSGELVPSVKFQDKDKNGKPITLKLNIDDAVKRMADMDEYSNLFQGEGSGGLGHNQSRKSGVLDLAEVAKDSKKYREMKKKGLINLD